MRAIRMIDLYNLFCLTLEIECGANDGSNDPNIWTKLFATNRIDQNKKSLNDV